MRNIPVFMAEGGTASLILREIPHRAIAYIRLLTVRDLPALAAECAAFCRGCGAETVLLTRGAEPLEGFSHAYDTLRLHVSKDMLPSPAVPCPLEPMTPDNDAIYGGRYDDGYDYDNFDDYDDYGDHGGYDGYDGYDGEDDDVREWRPRSAAERSTDTQAWDPEEIRSAEDQFRNLSDGALWPEEEGEGWDTIRFGNRDSGKGGDRP